MKKNKKPKLSSSISDFFEVLMLQTLISALLLLTVLIIIKSEPLFIKEVDNNIRSGGSLDELAKNISEIFKTESAPVGTTSNDVPVNNEFSDETKTSEEN